MNADRYQEQWSTLTGRSASSVYVPEALRSFELTEGARVVADDTVGGTVLSVSSTGLARVKWDDNGSISHEYIDEQGRVV